MEAAVLYAREHGDLRVPFTYRVPAGQDTATQKRPASLANIPLGQQTTDTRRFHTRDNTDQDHAMQPDNPGTI
ncbi:hypothetical protein [Streptomyces sp. NPDC056982]|uniref:hypothetical protein n=1 Tax=Streptomyces sp. NPDC056982 TaxID=3345986 RepID=UPI003627A4DC